MATGFLHAYFVFCFFSVALAAVASNSVTINSLTDFQGLRECARLCLYSGHGDLGEQLECGDDGLHTPYLDTCFCRTDLAVDGSSYLTSCINEGCTTNSVDLSGAISVWNSYCGFGSYATRSRARTSTAPANVPAQTSASQTTQGSSASGKLLSAAGATTLTDQLPAMQLPSEAS